MPIDESIAGREFSAARPYEVTERAVRAFAAATRASGDRVPATFPIVVAFHAMAEFIVAGGLDLSRVVHGDEHFAYERPLRIGDTLSATLTVDNVRDVSGNGFYSTTTRITDEAGDLVCTARATLVHRAAA
ncbi:FAS1-like dehydratase domain-containing protein [Nocardioides panacisoli]|uniref:MaoC family dehydratase N-terminal domain-containing protein n=1 Tax=Nocardioides panacisoli TaxID=627624 RepID=A0ABP7IBW1_9ACTN